MPWQRVTVVVDGAHAEALAAALEEEGALSVDVTDADAGTRAEHAVFAEPGAEGVTWPRARVCALFPSAANASRALEEAMARSATAPLEPACADRLEDTDWIAQTQRQFTPIRTGERLWIVPTWHAAPEPGAVNIVLDPGAAFGTGSHPTTRLCLAWLERVVDARSRVLDYGCGSGILGIAALKLGAESAIAIDIDPLALDAARYNSGRNGVALQVRCAEEALEGTATVTIANILANPLRMLAPVLAAHTEAGGHIALSGILEEQIDDVRAAYEPWAPLAVDSRAEGWVLLAGKRLA